LLFGSAEGLLVVSPAAIRRWTFVPDTRFTGLRVDGAERPFAPASSLTLQPGNRGFDVEFASLDLSAPDQVRYRYRLDGFDREWLPVASGRRSIAFTNLSPGAYTLRVEGSNRAGTWSGHEARLSVVVLPAFYQTRWFAGLIVTIVCAMAYGAYRARVAHLQRRGRELEQIVAERTADLQRAYARIEEASLTDPVTGIRNRRFLEQAIPSDLELARRRARRGEPGAEHICLLLDLDHFKRVNDRFGHAAGDAVLAQTARILTASVRASDYVVRWGGEEFLVVARFNDRADGGAIAEKIRAAIAAHVFSADGSGPEHVTCSIGIAVYPASRSEPEAMSWEAVIAAADEALYDAKRAGRNRWVSRIAG
jgi:diguanylate cyclase (GGDEF)-like protein